MAVKEEEDPGTKKSKSMKHVKAGGVTKASQAPKAKPAKRAMKAAKPKAELKAEVKNEDEVEDELAKGAKAKVTDEAPKKTTNAKGKKTKGKKDKAPQGVRIEIRVFGL